MKYHIQVFLSSLLFALSFVWSKGALEHLTPMALILARVFLAAVLVGAFTLLSRQMQRVSLRDFVWLMLLATAEPVGYFIFENQGLSRVSPTLACLIIALIPVLTPFAARFINKERVSRNAWIGLIVSFSGVVLVFLSDGLDAFYGQVEGVLLLFGAVLCAIIYLTLLGRITKKLNSFTIVTYINVISVLFLLPLVLLFDFQEVSTLKFDGSWFYPVLMLGVLCSSVAFIFNANGVRALGITTTTMYVNLMPGITAIASFALLGERLEVVKILGILITILGLFIANMKVKR